MLSKFITKISYGPMIRRHCTSTKKSTIIVEKLDHITTIGINRPEKRNCMNSVSSQLLKKAIEEFENDDDAYVGVLYGIGGNFCSGYDLGELAGYDDNFVSQGTSERETGWMGPTLRYIRKPMIAAVTGYAVAGGLELALMCDLRVMEETAVLGVYSRRFGVPLIDGGTVRLQAMIGLSRTLDLVLTGRSIDAKEALSWGLVNRIVACGTALGQSINLASSLVKFPQGCLNADRASVHNAAFSSTFERLIEFEQNNGTQVLTKESIDGAKKFVSGIGRHGKTYNLVEKEVSDWEKEYAATKETKPKSKL